MTMGAALPRIGLLFALAALVAWALLQRIRSRGPWAPLAFVAVVTLATVAFLPGAVFGLTGAPLFGPAWGCVWNLMGATLGATAAFLAARRMNARRGQA